MSKKSMKYLQGIELSQITVEKTGFKNFGRATSDLVISQQSSSIIQTYMRKCNTDTYAKRKWWNGFAERSALLGLLFNHVIILVRALRWVPRAATGECAYLWVWTVFQTLTVLNPFKVSSKNWHVCAFIKIVFTFVNLKYKSTRLETKSGDSKRSYRKLSREYNSRSETGTENFGELYYRALRSS